MTKKALLVGINDYATAGAGGPDLRGCVNDVRDMANTLNVLHIVPATPGTMQILTDARATKTAILNGFKWLIKGAKKGDVLIFYYSGHGSQVVDVSGEELDRKDETICPHDFATAGMLKDDDFRALLTGLPAGGESGCYLRFLSFRHWNTAVSRPGSRAGGSVCYLSLH